MPARASREREGKSEEEAEEDETERVVVRRVVRARRAVKCAIEEPRISVKMRDRKSVV